MQKLLIALVTSMVLPISVNAGVLNFNELPSGYQSSTSITLSNASVSTSGADIFVASPGSYSPSVGAFGGFCGLILAGGADCSVDSVIVFNDAISDLTFQATAHDAGDSAVASIYSGLTFIHSIAFSSALFVDFTGYSNFDRLTIDNVGSGGAGYVYGAFNFAAADTPAAVPAPATLALFGLGLLGLGFVRRKQS